jgi:hypothetical protein
LFPSPPSPRAAKTSWWTSSSRAAPPEHRAFFEENFRQKITAAGYTLLDSFDQAADYTLSVNVVEEDPPDPAYINDNYRPYYLTLTLMEVRCNQEILQLEWSYAQTDYLPFRYFGFSADLSATWSQKYEYETYSGRAYVKSAVPAVRSGKRLAILWKVLTPWKAAKT